MNKEERKIYNKKYHEQHKERIEAYLSVKVACELCGRKVRYSYMSRHKKSKYCTNHCNPSSVEDMSTLSDDQLNKIVKKLTEKGYIQPTS